MTTVPQWSGREVRALREARRMSLRQFAAHLGVSDRMVSKWESGGEKIRPRPMNQAALDTSLAVSNMEVRTRFAQLAGNRSVHIAATGPGDGVNHLVRHPIDGKLMTLIDAGRAADDSCWLPAYYVDVFPTTHADYARFVAATDHRAPQQWTGGRHTAALAETVLPVAWVDAQAYAVWASKELPTPAQWERAVRGDEGMVASHLPEWCTGASGPRRHHPKRAGVTHLGSTNTGFRCVLLGDEMLRLLAI